MSTRVNAEELQSTRTEKFLAVVLAAFLLVGAGWVYVKAHEWVAPEVRPTASEAAAFEARGEAMDERRRARGELERARRELDLAREAYNTALDDGADVAEREAAYRAAQREFEAARSELDAARAAAEEARQAARPAQQAHQKRINDARVRTAWIAAGLRLGLIVLWLAGSYWLIQVLRRRESRAQPLGLAVAAVGVLLSLVYATDYITDYIDPLDLGPIVLSAFGVAVTLVAFVALQRYLARRIPPRRVRKGECPFCGYPLRGDGPHCEGCGREVVAECAACAQPRRVGSAHCAACGAA